MTEQHPDPTGRDDRDNRTVERLRPLGETIFATMSRLAADTGAINLGQGYPDWDGPWPVLREAAAQILGGNKTVLVGSLIEELLMKAHNQPMAAALSVVLMLLTGAVCLILMRKAKHER